jgi:hypothetical protein
MFAIASLARAAAPEERGETEFGKDIQLGAFQVNGAPLSISIHARSKSDRHYAQKFADEVVDIAYYTVGEFSGRGLVIVGREGEPHPIHIMRDFVALDREGKLHPGMAPVAKELQAMLTKAENSVGMNKHDASSIDFNFEVLIPAIPVPLEGSASKLYQIAWSEKFERTRLAEKFQTLTKEDLGHSELSRFNWVFYLPPRSASATALNELISKVMAKEHMGLFKRAAIRSALVVFKPAVSGAIEAMRKGMLYTTILQAESPYSPEDVRALTGAYIKANMPDLKPGAPDRAKILAAIDKQKAANEAYAKDPFKTPARLATYDPATYASFIGEYSNHPTAVTHWFKQEAATFYWNYKDQNPRPFYPAGNRLLVSEDGRMTIEFLVDSAGAVTGVEERWHRRRQTIAKWTPPPPGAKKKKTKPRQHENDSQQQVKSAGASD